jgi:hypothetical protein
MKLKETDMDLNKIREKCPKAWEKLREWDFKRPAINHWRRLYDFFDEQDIHVLPYLDVGDMDDWGFDCSIKNGSNNHLTLISSKGATRPEAEANAFEKAFEILEERLN